MFDDWRKENISFHWVLVSQKIVKASTKAVQKRCCFGSDNASETLFVKMYFIGLLLLDSRNNLIGLHAKVY